MGSLGALKRQRAPVGRSQESDIIKGSLVHKLPSCGRMSMASLVITSTTTVAVCRWERLSTATVQECFHGCGPRSGKAVDKMFPRLRQELALAKFCQKAEAFGILVEDEVGKKWLRP